MSTMREKMRRELEAERKQQENLMAATKLSEPKEVELEKAPVLPTIFYTCPDISPAVLPKDEMDKHIEEFLLSQLCEEPEMTSALMIQTLNKDKEKVNICVETLGKILSNIIANPDEEKFRKIRLSTKTFTEKIDPIKGANEFLQTAGFHIVFMKTDEQEESYYIMDESSAKETEHLTNMKDVLNAATPLKSQLDRCLKVFHPTGKASSFDIPPEFYSINPDELRKEQKRKQEAVENLGMLRTKAMRERDELRELRKYRFTLLRIRLPDSTILQGTFRAIEKMSALFVYVRENLANDWIPFNLSSSGHQLSEDDTTLVENGLCPAAVVNFAFDEAIVKEMAAQQGATVSKSVLKQEVMALLENL